MASGYAERIYNGQALTNGTVTATGFVEGEGAVYTVTGWETYVDWAENTFSYVLNDGTLADNYDIEKVYVELTVSKRKLKMDSGSAERIYKGQS